MAYSYVIHHLRQKLKDCVDDKVDDEEGCRILFGSLGAREAHECDMFWQLWLSGRSNIQVLQRWFAGARDIADLGTVQQDWMTEASLSVQKLLQPLAMTAAKLWLTKTGYDDVAYLDVPGSDAMFQVWFLKGYLALDDTGRLEPSLRSWKEAEDMNSFNFSAQEVEHLAAWANIDRDTHWYTCVGWTVLHCGKYGRAIELLQHAIDLVGALSNHESVQLELTLARMRKLG